MKSLPLRASDPELFARTVATLFGCKVETEVQVYSDKGRRWVVHAIDYNGYRYSADSWEGLGNLLMTPREQA